MARNPSGTYTLPAGNPVVSGSIISSSWANSTLNDIASALTDSLSRSGEGGMNAPLRVDDGTSSVPGIGFVDEVSSGIYRAGAGDWRMTVLGAVIAKLTASGLDITADTFSIESDTAYYPQMLASNTTADANAAYYVFNKDRAGAIVQSSDILGNIVFRGYDGTNYLQAAGIIAQVSGTPGTNDMPGDLIFLATADGNPSPSERLRVKGDGHTVFTGTGYSPNIALTDAATVAWDTSSGQVATFTFGSSNRSMGAPTSLVSGGFYALAVIQNGGNNTLTWNSVFKWTGGSAPTLSTAAGARDYFVFRSDGTNLYEQGRSLGVA